MLSFHQHHCTGRTSVQARQQLEWFHAPVLTGPCRACRATSTARNIRTRPPKAPKVALVLGAGNQVSVVVLDILHMLLVVDCTVVCKINPVNAFIGLLSGVHKDGSCVCDLCSGTCSIGIAG